MCLLQLFCLCFQNKLVAACVCAQKKEQGMPRISVFPSNIHAVPAVCTSVPWTFQAPVCVLVNAQVCEQQLIQMSRQRKRCGSREVLSFICQTRKNHTAALRGKLRPKSQWIQAGSLPEVMPAQGRLWPLLLPAAHLPSSNLRVLVLGMETLCSSRCLSR